MENFFRTIPMLRTGLVIMSLAVFSGCHLSEATAFEKKVEKIKTPDTLNATTAVDETKIADAATILSQPQVPILCYHQIREWRSTDSKVAKNYIVPVATFKEQIKMLADSGYHS